MKIPVTTFKKVIESILLISIACWYSSAHAEKSSDNRYLKDIQSIFNQKDIATEIDNSKIDLCHTYSMPRDLCKKGMPVQRILSTEKLSMNKYGDIKAISEEVLNNAKFIRVEKSVHTYDDGLYFYQCAEFVNKKKRITLNTIGINEDPSVGWFFWSVFSSSPCKVSDQYQGAGL